MYTNGRYAIGFNLYFFVIAISNTIIRALWGAMLKSKVVKSNSELVGFAKQKLLGGNYDQISEVQSNHQVAASIAILASRCALDISPVCVFTFEFKKYAPISRINLILLQCLATQLIRNHMGTCVSVSMDCEIVTVAYPSEPVLAEAAAQFMSDPASLEILLQHFYTNFCRGFVGTIIYPILVYHVLIRSI